MKFLSPMLVAAFFMIFISAPANAKQFANEYTQFELPPGWECMLEGSEWVCQSTNDARKKEAIIILVAKIRGPQDTEDQYLAYLKKSKSYKLPGGKAQVSEPKYAKIVDINNQKWVDSLHLASEVPGFFTRYLATTKEDLGMAVTFSVSKEHYSAYSNVFDRVIQSLRVFRQKQVNVQQYAKGQDDSLFDASVIGGDEGVGGPIVGSNQKKRRRSSSGNDNMIYIIIIAAVAGGGFFLMKKKGKKKKKKK